MILATIKSYTDISQSRKLAEFLPLESADMQWFLEEDYGIVQIKEGLQDWGGDCTVPCWSLAALVNYLREIDSFPEIEADEHGVTMSINYYDEEEARLLTPVHNIKVKAESFIDACYEMILKLHELKML